MEKKAKRIGRAGDREDEFISYTNTCRDDPIEWRYKGQDRIARLKALKKQWDPTGVFTKELL
jgi:FAD/FMN-containing dehydrogenase